MSRLIVVSNRVPVPTANERAGGLAVVLHDLLAERGGVWFGWSGETSDDPARTHTPAVIESDGVQYATIDLTLEEYRAFYVTFSNSTLWPIVHSLPEQVRFDKRSLLAYRAVNARFADALLPMIRPDDILWVHDYHLLPLAADLRARKVTSPIGFFLHTPFPSPDILSAIPQATMFLHDLLQNDLIGFQTPHDTANFRTCVERLTDARIVSNSVVEHAGRRIRIGDFPVEIDAHAFAATAAEQEYTPEVRGLVESLRGTYLLIGADRMDPTKGIRRRLSAYRTLLRQRPDWQRRVTFLQVAASSRQDVEAYQFLRENLESLSGALNAELSEPDWVPLRLVTRSVARTSLAGYMRKARVGVVTPLRDGMNLVAKEFVAAQNPDNPGVLVLSRYAGAALQLSQALLVNAFDADEVTEAMHTALTMPLAERQRRWRACWDAVAARTPLMWGESFIRALTDASRPPG